MNLNEFNQRLVSEGHTRTEFFSELATKLKEKNIIGDSSDIQISATANGDLSKFVLHQTSADPVRQFEGVNATINILKKYGATDLEQLKPFDPNVDPYSFNIVYKDGGWVYNS